MNAKYNIKEVLRKRYGTYKGSYIGRRWET